MEIAKLTDLSNSQITAPGICHIHIDPDARYHQSNKEYLDEAVRRWSFKYAPFTGTPLGHEHLIPDPVMTLKLDDTDIYKDIWNQIYLYFYNSSFVGYIEGEFIKRDEIIPFQPFQGLDKAPPRILEKRQVTSKEKFKKYEFHLVMSNDHSDPRLVESLLTTGLSPAYLEKKDYTALSLTGQGMIQPTREFGRRIEEYVASVGGCAFGTFKEEFIMNNHLLVNMDVSGLPKIIETIE